jgi:hypothetical protein
MKNGREQWKDLPLVKRYEVYSVYMEILYKYEGYTLTFEQCDKSWENAWAGNIITTFGIRENIERHYQNLMKCRG